VSLEVFMVVWFRSVFFGAVMLQHWCFKGTYCHLLQGSGGTRRISEEERYKLIWLGCWQVVQGGVGEICYVALTLKSAVMRSVVEVQYTSWRQQWFITKQLRQPGSGKKRVTGTHGAFSPTRLSGNCRQE
jgi:hypothetical protein